MNKVIKYVGIGALACLASCGDTSRNFAKEGEVNGYEAMVFVHGTSRNIRIYTEDKRGLLSAVDRENDGRFDIIDLEDLPRGHPLEAYASLEKLEQAYDGLVGE